MDTGFMPHSSRVPSMVTAKEAVLGNSIPTHAMDRLGWMLPGALRDTQKRQKHKKAQKIHKIELNLI